MNPDHAGHDHRHGVTAATPPRRTGRGATPPLLPSLFHIGLAARIALALAILVPVWLAVLMVVA